MSKNPSKSVYKLDFVFYLKGINQSIRFHHKESAPLRGLRLVISINPHPPRFSLKGPSKILYMLEFVIFFERNQSKC